LVLKSQPRKILYM